MGRHDARGRRRHRWRDQRRAPTARRAAARAHPPQAELQRREDEAPGPVGRSRGRDPMSAATQALAREQLAGIVDRVLAVMWPPGHPDADWSADTLDEVT